MLIFFLDKTWHEYFTLNNKNGNTRKFRLLRFFLFRNPLYPFSFFILMGLPTGPRPLQYKENNISFSIMDKCFVLKAPFCIAQSSQLANVLPGVYDRDKWILVDCHLVLTAVTIVYIILLFENLAGPLG